MYNINAVETKMNLAINFSFDFLIVLLIIIRDQVGMVKWTIQIHGHACVCVYTDSAPGFVVCVDDAGVFWLIERSL